MRVLIFSREPKDIEDILSANGFEVVDDNPDIVISVGGDGTLLLSESEWPGIPKLAIGKSKSCKKCIHERPEETIERLAEYRDNLPITEYAKISAKLDGKDLPLALNDVVLRNKDQMHAIRFTAKIDSALIAEAIGDGVVISTSFGSTAYYQSITRKSFTSGMGIAFNNTTEEINPLMTETGMLVIEMTRGSGSISIDTLEETWQMESGQILTAELSEKKARIIEF